jgi:hypothetical protein
MGAMDDQNFGDTIRAFLLQMSASGRADSSVAAYARS